MKLDFYPTPRTLETNTSLQCVWMFNILDTKSKSYYRPQRNWSKVIFSQASAILSTGGAWTGVCVAGGMHGCGGMRGREGGMLDMHAPQGRYYGYGIRSMSGRCASYWNAFLLQGIIIVNKFNVGRQDCLHSSYSFELKEN